MYHLTHTGYYAGTLYCGRNRAEEVKKGFSFMHMNIKFIKNNPEKICPDCLKIFNQS